MSDTATLEPQSSEVKAREASSSWAGGIVVHLSPMPRLNREQLVEFCQANSELRIEQTAEGELIIMPPVSGDTGFREVDLAADFVIWARAAAGKVFGPSTGFTLPNGAMSSPDVSWVRQEQLDRLTPEQWASFAPLCPDFVLELRSRTDRLPKLKEKMAEYLANGARLGWLIDPLEKQVFVYRPDAPVEHLKAPVSLSGEPVLAGFTLDLARVWSS